MRHINQFFHRQAAVDSLCLYRALIGAVICLEALIWLCNYRECLSNAGFHVPNISGWPAPPPAVAFLLGLALVLSGLMVAVGLCTRFALIATLGLWGYFYAMDSINEKAAQTIVIIALTVLSFSRCGNRLSIDHLLRVRKGRPAKPGEGSIFWQRLLQIEFAQIYFFSGVAKMTNPDWVNGNSFYRILNSRWATELGVFISAHNPDFIARAGGLGTILFELFQGFFLFVPALRPFAIGLGVLFHSGIQMTLWIGSLGTHFILALLLLFPEPETWAAHVRKFAAARRR